MPIRNVVKQDAPDSFQHVYTRGHSRHKIFIDEEDYLTFLNLLQRYLSPEETKTLNRTPYPNFYNKVDLLAFCLMPNHIHMLIYQRQPHAMAQFMRSLLTSYVGYFNKKYKRSGSLFESKYKASMIENEPYLQHITRYIHMNPKHWLTYEWSSLPYYLQQAEVSWVRPKRVLSQFATPAEYLNFLEDYVDRKNMYEIIKHELAN